MLPPRRFRAFRAFLPPQLTAAGLDATGAKPELSARVKAARSGKPLPAASECASQRRSLLPAAALSN